MNEQKKTLLSIKDLVVKFRVRGRVLTAIRGISLDIYENESIAIVGESGSGKSVFTKTFAGMLDQNGFIDQGSLIFSDDELADTRVKKTRLSRFLVARAEKALDRAASAEAAADLYRQIKELEAEKRARETLPEEKRAEWDAKLNDLLFRRTEAFNYKQTLDASRQKAEMREVSAKIAEYDAEIKALRRDLAAEERACAEAARAETGYLAEYKRKTAELQAAYREKKAVPVTDPAIAERNLVIAKEICLSVGRYPFFSRLTLTRRLVSAVKRAMIEGTNLSDEETRNAVFDNVVFRVRYLDENEETLHGTCILNLAKIKYSKDWTQIRGGRIATVFQDPMTSLNPIITIGKQITSVILKHQKCSETEAKARALMLMKKVGIPDAENRFDDYPFQYSGGMRQRIVIAIALSCQPKILICDEPTTALDVTIQAQILKLLKDLQKEFKYTIVFITHDLGVVAKIADRVAVLYAGQMVEIGTAEEVFYDPRHPYTWVLLSSMPQLAERNTVLYSIAGTPPSLYNKIVGDPFAPRNPYCLKVDTLVEPPVFRVSETHFAKTWLLDPRAPKVEKPEIIRDTYNKLIRAFNVDMQGVDNAEKKTKTRVKKADGEGGGDRV
ncbi:MAG: ATP-binding cassette domain-containing protein [Clostridia bacterium]|nr:ATP-binding cassette domain-containing protein [Clostridia bacterium]